MDIETEYEIIGAMRSFIKDRICIVVSHRLAPLAQADQLIVMEKGKIIAQGDHAYLLQEMNFDVAETAYFLVCNADRGADGFFGKMVFSETLIPYEWSSLLVLSEQPDGDGGDQGAVAKVG